MDKLQLLIDFLNSLPGKATDFYPVGAGFHRPILDKVPAEQLQIIGRTGADCLIGLWQPPTADEKGDGERPCVWIDSEGTPNAVFALGIEDCLRLLYFGTGFIYDVLASLENGNFSSKTDADLEFYRTLAVQSYEEYGPLRNYLQHSLELNEPTRPEWMIKAAWEKYPGFSDWLNGYTSHQI